MIIGITGQCIDSLGRKRIAGAGKDVVAKYLVDNFNFVSLAWADPIKRFCQEVYGFSDEALWGESDARILPDQRYPSPNGGFLTPRTALQQLGTNWGRNCYLNTWVDYGIRVAKTLLTDNWMVYSAKSGLIPRHETTCQGEFESIEGFPNQVTGVVFSDVRFDNELQAIKNAGGKVIRIKRQMTIPYDDKAMNLLHLSETELANISDDNFDYVIDNSGTLEDLNIKVSNMVEYFRSYNS
jgi:hypothetical protein